MKTADVKKLSPLERFLYWIRERHQVYLRRRAGKPKPWTDDEVLQKFFFTNPYRENDKVTQWFRTHIREPLRDDPRVLFATVAFRWFNLPATADVLMGTKDGVRDGFRTNLLVEWDPKEARLRLEGRSPIFTGAYMINSPAGEPKLTAILRRITNVWEARKELLQNVEPEHPTINDPGASCSMEAVHRRLTAFDGLGGFMAYEIVCDLRYTYLLENAPDKLTWCNPGPGCARGLLRIAGEDFPKGNNATSPPLPKDWLERMKTLLQVVRQRLPKMPPFEMREIEHSLCEYDKYERALAEDGKMKRRYAGV